MIRSIVVIIGSRHDASQLSALAGEPSRLQQLIESSTDGVSVTLISNGLDRPIPGLAAHVNLAATQPSAIDRVLSRLGATALFRRLATFPIGRLLNSMGPVDAGRVFWRTVRGSRDAMEALAAADIAIAADMPAVRTAWKALRAQRVTEAYYDHRATSLGITFGIPTARN
ncbi:hypothetical protein BKA04_000888 [Cryobacterium mesophilum]|uniref:Uncharacterized protein n=1 Tax=Terrimesophilobacter mesophilus TaxID=433647 RepID=A0A4R8VAA7_9MICO|nr:hypothetical protein [Terrimesophilobacter mesophilus]MBB5632665.1 hypothetical protein [Terrimesophilobacter mesophilus]TFB79475.1 hypothetical protein E3N84_05050 [Terrimesophilobacter mesophilus]